jgi:hypothetical protein
MTEGITLQEMDGETVAELVKRNEIGQLADLNTSAKGNIVNAINELFTNVSSGKISVAAAITGKGVEASGSDTFMQLSTKIGQIQRGLSNYFIHRSKNYLFDGEAIDIYNLVKGYSRNGLFIKESSKVIRLQAAEQQKISFTTDTTIDLTFVGKILFFFTLDNSTVNTANLYCGIQSIKGADENSFIRSTSLVYNNTDGLHKCLSVDVSDFSGSYYLSALLDRPTGTAAIAWGHSILLLPSI